MKVCTPFGPLASLYLSECSFGVSASQFLHLSCWQWTDRD